MFTSIIIAIGITGSGVALTWIGIELTFRPPEDRRSKVRARVEVSLSALALLVFTVWGTVRSEMATRELQETVRNLQSQTFTLMNALRLQITLDDFRHLEGQMADRFDRLEMAIKGAKIPPQSSQQQTRSLPPAVVEHVRIVQRRAASDNPNTPYGLQVVMQTDVAIQPVAFRIECDREISDGNVFIVGQGAYTSFATGFTEDKKAFLFSFRTPAFTPDSSLVVSLRSKYDIRVTKVEKIQPLF